jgi:hypothetical protein
MADRTVTTTYTAKLDNQSYTKVEKSLKDQSKKQVKATQDTANNYDDMRKSLLGATKASDKLNKSQKQSNKQAKTRLEILEKQNTAMRNQVGSVGDVDSALSAVRGGAGAVTGADLGGLEAVAGIFELTEAAVQLKAAAPVAAESLKGLVSGIGAGGLAVAASAAIIVGAFAIISAASKEQAEDYKGIAEGFKGLNLELEQGTLTTEEVQKRLTDLNTERRAEQRNLEALETEYNHYIESMGLAGVAARIASDAEQARVEAIDESKKALKEFDTAALGLGSTLTSTRIQMNDANQALLDQVDSIAVSRNFENQAMAQTVQVSEDRANALEQQNDIITEQISTIKLSGIETDETRAKLESLTDQLALNAEQISYLNDVAIPYNQTIENEAKLKKETEEEVEARSKKIADDRKKRSADEERALTRLNALNEQSIKLIDEFARKQSETLANRQLRDLREQQDYSIEQQRALKDHNDEIAKLNRDADDARKDFMRDEIEATNQYQVNLNKLNTQYRREDETALSDHLSDLRTAQQNNDVIAFLQAKQQFEKDQQQKERDRSDEFRELNRQHREERRLRQEAYTQQRRDLMRQMADTRQAFAQSQQQAAQARQLQLQRQQQDDAIADARARQALQRSLNDINLKAQAEMRAVRSVLGVVRQLEMVASRIASRAGSSSTSSMSRSASNASYQQRLQRTQLQNAVRNSSSSSAAFLSHVRMGGAFARGGIVDRPTLGLVGEGGNPEAIIPFNRSKGLQSALVDYGIVPRGGAGSNGSVVVNFAPNLTVGDIASGAEVSRALQTFSDDLQMQIATGFNRAVNQTA